MSRLLPDMDAREFYMGDHVSFRGPDGGILVGEIVRVYNTRDMYHVLVNGLRYSVDTSPGSSDDVRLVKTW